MDVLQLQQMSLEAARHLQQQLQRIDGVLRRIDAGRFGLCFRCGEEMELRRLSADPTITRCRQCAEGS